MSGLRCLPGAQAQCSQSGGSSRGGQRPAGDSPLLWCRGSVMGHGDRSKLSLTHWQQQASAGSLPCRGTRSLSCTSPWGGEQAKRLKLLD